MGALVSPEEIDSCLVGGVDLFPDMSTDNTFTSFICIVKERGLVGGTSAGTFAPDAYITVGQAAKIISNGFCFTDISDPYHVNPFFDFVYNFSERGAKPDTVFNLDQELYREAMAEMFFI